MSYIGKQPRKAALTSSDIEDGIITAAKIEDGAVVAAEIASNAVTTAKINADAVTAAKIADNAVVTAGINADAVDGTKIADNAINSEHYTDGSIDTAHIADVNVTQGKIADQAINEAKMQISNAPQNGYMLTAQSGNTGGLTWAAAPTGFDPDGAVVFNESSADADFRIESNASTHFFNLDSNLNTLSFGGDTATDNDTGKFKINADGQVRFGGFAGNPSGGGGSGYTQTNDRTGSLMIDTSGGITHQNTNSNAYFNYRGSTQHNNYWNFRYGGSQVGSIQWSSGSTAFNTSSDYRLKENVNYSWDATTRLKQLKPARFNWIADETNTLIDGFIAHEAATVVPESVSGTKDALEQHDEFSEEVKAGTKNVGDNKLNDDGNTIIKPQAIDHSKLVPLLVKTIQELEARITTLENA